VLPATICHSMCGPDQDSDIILGTVRHLGWTSLILSLNKPSLFACNLVGNNQVLSNMDNIAFHRSSAVIASLALFRAFCPWKI